MQILEDGSVRLQTVIPDADAQHEFIYTFGGGVIPVEGDDGVIELVEEFDGGVISYGQIDQAWAVDADGEDVGTAYRIKGAPSGAQGNPAWVLHSRRIQHRSARRRTLPVGPCRGNRATIRNVVADVPEVLGVT